MNSVKVKCPVCAKESGLVTALPAKLLAENLSEYFDGSVPVGAIETDYELRRCKSCQLEFANPMAGGSGLFYDWITQFDEYYPKERWEWGKVIDLVSAEVLRKRSVRILEVGCGAGDFMERIQVVKGAEVFGIDMTQESVTKARAKGLNAECESVEGFLDKFPAADGAFDFIVAFHTLEHISDPLGFLSQTKRLLGPSGQLLLSTPYSPMSIESAWLDPLNVPPHHLTRWNKSSYLALAHKVGLDAEFHFPDSPSVARRTLRAFRLAVFGKSTKPSVLQQFLAVPANLSVFSKVWTDQRSRDRHEGKPVADVVLVSLSTTI